MNEMMIVTVGEVVWDCFPDKKVLGGAPVNVAYHLTSLGHDVLAVSRVGDDELGRETLAKIRELNLSTEGVQIDRELPTGQVAITFDQQNEPKFDIVAPAAWDAIEAAEAISKIAGRPFSLVFGTLAQRDRRSREAIAQLQEKASYRFYDVNLRPPYTTKELVVSSLSKADTVKVNDNELRILGNWCGWPESMGDQGVAEKLIEKFGLEALVVTEGPDGAWVIVDGNYYKAEAEPITVADTVGAGDAFFAALIHGKIQRKPWVQCLKEANRRGGYVASQAGATPKIS